MNFPHNVWDVKLGLGDWLGGWLCQRDFSGSTNCMNFQLCTQTACGGRSSLPTYFFLNFWYFCEKCKKKSIFTVNVQDLQMTWIWNCLRRACGGRYMYINCLSQRKERLKRGHGFQFSRIIFSVLNYFGGFGIGMHSNKCLLVFLCYFSFSEKYAKFNFCIEVNSRALPAYNPAAVLRTSVTSSRFTCYIFFKKN